jgi:hypothetical protein
MMAEKAMQLLIGTMPAMRRLMRWLFNFAAVVSLLMCLATTVLWIRSYLVADQWFYEQYWDDDSWSHRGQSDLQSGSGGIGYNRIVSNYSLDVGWQELQKQDAHRMAVAGAVTGRNFYFFHTERPLTYPDFRMRVNDDPWLGFKFGTLTTTRRTRLYAASVEAIVPFWSVVLTFAVVPFVWCLRWYARRRRKHSGACQACGYDLRATPERCPECGTVPQAAKEAAP